MRARRVLAWTVEGVIGLMAANIFAGGHAALELFLAVGITLGLEQLRHRRLQRRWGMTVAHYVEQHGFPSETVEEWLRDECGAESLEEVRRNLDAWNAGYRRAEDDARDRRSRAARRGRR